MHGQNNICIMAKSPWNLLVKPGEEMEIRKTMMEAFGAAQEVDDAGMDSGQNIIIYNVCSKLFFIA